MVLEVHNDGQRKKAGGAPIINQLRSALEMGDNSAEI
jgi:hypothetical protein